MRVIALTLLTLLALALAQSQPHAIQVQEAWVRLMPPVLKSTSAYLSLSNPSERPLRLVGAASPLAQSVVLMTDFREVRGGCRECAT